MAPTAPTTGSAVELAPRGGQLVKPGRLPVSELAYDRAGAASPFGDDLRFPLPVAALTYLHPEPDPDLAPAVASH
jgi:hypothetical protein